MNFKKKCFQVAHQTTFSKRGGGEDQNKIPEFENFTIDVRVHQEIRGTRGLEKLCMCAISTV
jgi:hypothetical protein